MVIQLALLTAVQLHPLGAVTLTLPVPPLAGKDALVGEIEYVQLGGGGGVTFVTPPPQPVRNKTANKINEERRGARCWAVPFRGRKRPAAIPAPLSAHLCRSWSGLVAWGIRDDEVARAAADSGSSKSL
jgi:hypothetical protein